MPQHPSSHLLLSSWRVAASRRRVLVACPREAAPRTRSPPVATPSAPYAEVQIDTYPRIDLELARTPQEHEYGLMYREYLPPDSGMLFVYTLQANEAYWMYHTLIPLSIAWIDRDGTIVDIQDMPRLNNPDDMQEAARHVYPPRGAVLVRARGQPGLVLPARRRRRAADHASASAAPETVRLAPKRHAPPGPR